MSVLREFAQRYLIPDASPLSPAERWRSTLAALLGMLLIQGILAVLPAQPRTAICRSALVGSKFGLSDSLSPPAISGLCPKLTVIKSKFSYYAHPLGETTQFVEAAFFLLALCRWRARPKQRPTIMPSREKKLH
jgi:hypothetical protein